MALRKERSSVTLATEASTEKIDHRPVWEQAYTVLRAHILDGRLPPGTVLNLRELAAQLGVSVTPARDALLRLESEGLVEGSGGRGLRVTQLTERDITQTLELRIVLEVLALTQSAPLLARKNFRQLENILADENDLLAENNEQVAKAYTEAGRAFHHALVVAAENKPLLDLYERLHMFVVMERAQRGFGRDRMEEDHREHLAVLDALRRHAHAEACQLLKEHLERVRDYSLERYRSQAASAEPIQP